MINPFRLRVKVDIGPVHLTMLDPTPDERAVGQRLISRISNTDNPDDQEAALHELETFLLGMTESATVDGCTPEECAGWREDLKAASFLRQGEGVDILVALFRFSEPVCIGDDSGSGGPGPRSEGGEGGTE